MAALIKWLRESAPGQLLTALAYALMLMLILAFFTGHGAFIYEGF